jgi:S-phase kinase-associated protein 1
VWDADFVAGFDHQTLFDIILASEHLQLRGLIVLACQAIADKIKDKSPREICRIFNIKSVSPLPEPDDQEMLAKQSHDQLELEEKSLRALT